MAKNLFKNNAGSVLGASLNTLSTTLTVQSGDGVKFPAPAANEFFIATLFLDNGANEIVKCTQRLGDTLTIERAQEGTQAQAWTASVTRIEMRSTAGMFDRFEAAVKRVGDETGAAAMPRGTTAQRPLAPEDGYTRFNTDLQSSETYNSASGAWEPTGKGASGGVGNPICFEHDLVMSKDYTVKAGKCAIIGALAIDATLTIEDGARAIFVG